MREKITYYTVCDEIIVHLSHSGFLQGTGFSSKSSSRPFNYLLKQYLALQQKKREVSSSLVCSETTSSPSQSQAQQLPETTQTLTNDIRCKVQKWVKDYNKGELDTMIEGDDYIGV